MKISLENIGTVVDSYKRALESYKKNEEVKEEVTREAEEKPVAADKPAHLTGIFASDDATLNLEESGKQIAAEKEAEKAPETVTTPTQPSETEGEGVTVLSDDFINNNKWLIMNCTIKEYIDICWNGGVYRSEPTQEVIEEFAKYNDLDYTCYESKNEWQEYK